MNLHQEWMTDSSLFGDDYAKNVQLQQAKDRYDIQRYQSNEGSPAIIDTIATQVIVQSHSNPLNEGKYDKKIHMPIDTIVNTGSIVEWENNKWIIVSNIDNLQAYKTASMIRCNNTIQFYSSSSTLHTIPCIISKGSISLDEQKIISTLDSEIAVQISNTSITRQIEINDVYKIGLRSWQVTNIDDITVNGLLILRMVYSEVEQVFPVYSVEILNGTTTSTQQGNNIQLNVQVKDHDMILSPTPSVIYTSSDITKAMVSSTGLISTLSVGTSTITCKLQSDNNIFDTFVVNVEAIPVVETYTLELTGSIQPDSEIKSGQVKTYACVKKNSLGVVVSGTMFDFSIVNGTTLSSAYTFTVLNDTQVSLKANQYTYYIDLVAVDRSDNTLTVSKHIKLRSVM